jgi:hypothetical protein
MFQLYYAENRLVQQDDNNVRFALNQHAYLDFYSAS